MRLALPGASTAAPLPVGAPIGSTFACAVGTMGETAGVFAIGWTGAWAQAKPALAAKAAIEPSSPFRMDCSCLPSPYPTHHAERDKLLRPHAVRKASSRNF